MREASRRLIVVATLLALSMALGATFSTAGSPASSAAKIAYLPIIYGNGQQSQALRRINAPYFSGPIRIAETAVFWFGRVQGTENYADVRVGYTNSELYLKLAAFDRRIWYDTTPSRQDLTSWDAATVYLDTQNSAGTSPSATSYQFVAQFNNNDPPADYQAVYRGNGSGWAAATLPFTSAPGWRGDSPNNDVDDRGWAMSFHIPFSSLGRSGPPPQGTLWRLAVVMHDRDSAAGPPLAAKTWPEAATTSPASWGQLGFGMPTYSPPTATPRQIATIRHKLNGASVVDAGVGGDTSCGEGLDYWAEWGQENYAGVNHLNIQNQSDVGDWPCFSKVYMTFPLDAIPAGKAIISATLTLHQFGNAGDAGQAKPSLIQVSTVAESWSEATINWNNAPLATQNVGAAWVTPMSGELVWPGPAWTWDLSRAVAEARASGRPLRLAIYSADDDYHSGKYFTTSEAEDWDEEGRPTLRVRWGDPR